MDLVFIVDHIPKPGETRQSQGFAMVPGGKGANQAVACAKQGIKTLMLGSVGKDALSEQCLASLDDGGVDTGLVSRHNKASCGLAAILLEAGENRILTHGGANHRQDVTKVFHALKSNYHSGDYLLSQLEIPIEDIHQVFEKAKHLGLTTVLNAAPAKQLNHDLLSLIDLLVINEIEGKTLTGFSDKDAMINQLLSQGVGAVLLTRGEKGAMYKDAKTFLNVKAYEVDVVDTTAAGDTFIGVYLAQRIIGKNIHDSMRYASAGAALSVQKLGAQTSIPTKFEIDSFVKRSDKQ